MHRIVFYVVGAALAAYANACSQSLHRLHPAACWFTAGKMRRKTASRTFRKQSFIKQGMLLSSCIEIAGSIKVPFALLHVFQKREMYLYENNFCKMISDAKNSISLSIAIARIGNSYILLP